MILAQNWLKQQNPRKHYFSCSEREYTQYTHRQATQTEGNEKKLQLSGQSGTWTRDLRISSPAPWPKIYDPTFCNWGSAIRTAQFKSGTVQIPGQNSQLIRESVDPQTYSPPPFSLFPLILSWFTRCVYLATFLVSGRVVYDIRWTCASPALLEILFCYWATTRDHDLQSIDTIIDLTSILEYFSSQFDGLYFQVPVK